MEKPLIIFELLLNEEQAVGLASEFQGCNREGFGLSKEKIYST